jgi:hypothetical protein
VIGFTAAILSLAKSAPPILQSKSCYMNAGVKKAEGELAQGERSSLLAEPKEASINF